MSEGGEAVLREVIETLLEYAKDKGQIPDLPRFFQLKLLEAVIYRKFKVRLNVDGLIRVWSVMAPATREPLWLKVIREVSGISSKTEIITQVAKRKMVEKT